MCAVITVVAPAANAARNGTRSRTRSVARSSMMSTVVWCVSWGVIPWPGKCFGVVATPAASDPRTHAATNAATRSGSSPNERIPITGLRGSALTSQTGAWFSVMPSARRPSPTARAARSAYDGSPVAAIAIALGKTARYATRTTVPTSWSTATGTGGRPPRRAASIASPSIARTCSFERTFPRTANRSRPPSWPARIASRSGPGTSGPSNPAHTSAPGPSRTGASCARDRDERSREGPRAPSGPALDEALRPDGPGDARVSADPAHRAHARDREAASGRDRDDLLRRKAHVRLSLPRHPALRGGAAAARRAQGRPRRDRAPELPAVPHRVLGRARGRRDRRADEPALYRAGGRAPARRRGRGDRRRALAPLPGRETGAWRHEGPERHRHEHQGGDAVRPADPLHAREGEEGRAPPAVQGRPGDRRVPRPPHGRGADGRRRVAERHRGPAVHGRHDGRAEGRDALAPRARREHAPVALVVHEPQGRARPVHDRHAALPCLRADRRDAPRGAVRVRAHPRAAVRSRARAEGHPEAQARHVPRRAAHLQRDHQLAARDEVRPAVDPRVHLGIGAADGRDREEVQGDDRRTPRRGLRADRGGAGHALQSALRERKAEGREHRRAVPGRRGEDRRPRDRLARPAGR